MIDERDVSARFHAAFVAQPPHGAAERLRFALLATEGRRRGRSRLTLSVSLRIVAVVALVLTIITAGGAFAAIHLWIRNAVPAAPTRPYAVARSSAAAGEGGWSSPVGMVTETTGWDVTASQILRTTDSGRTWADVSPAIATIERPSSYYMLDANHIWFIQTVAAAGQQQIFTMGTRDGGATWTKSAAVVVASQDYGAAHRSGLSLDFVDARDGWILLQPYDWMTSGPRLQAAHLYRTTDGGATWTEITHITLGAGASVAGGPRCWWSGFAFGSTTDGWLTQDGSCFETGNRADPLIVTHDAGATWSAAVYPVCCTGGELVVFDRKHLSLGDSVTSDGGMSWTNRTASSSADDFVDPLHGWFDDGSNDLYATTDGGHTWSRVNAALPFGSETLQFVDSHNGYVFEPSGQLWKTTDSGRRWTFVIWVPGQP